MIKFKKNPFHDRVLTEVKELSDKRKYTIREYRDRFFFPDEWMAFYDALKDKQKITFNFLISTGARINEVRHVLVKDVDFERKNIVFRWTKARNKDGTRRIRTIPISTEFRNYLRRVINEYNLKAEDKFPILSTPSANIAMKKTLQKIGIPDWQMFSVHNVRKTTEMFLEALDVPADKRNKHMGHSGAVAFKHYVSPDVFSYEDRSQMRLIIGDLYAR